MARETADFLIQTLKEAYPNVDTRIGTVPRDWLITPMSILLEPYEAQRANIGTRQLIENYELLTDEEMDDLASNLFIYRNLGVRARADIILGFSQPTSVTVDAGTIIENADGTKQYTVVNTFSASRATVGGNQQADGLYYTAPIATQATEPGETQVAQADELVYMPFPPVGLERVTNPDASLWGAARETNTELYSRILAAISTRQIMNVPGTEGVLLARFRHIEEILLVGTGHELMARDETFSYTDLSGSLLPIASMYGKVRGDGTNKNRALRLTTTAAVPAMPSAFAVEVSQTEYQGLGVLDDSEVARLDTGLILNDTFGARPAFQEVETLLTLDANATSDITVTNAAFFGVGDLVEVLDTDTAAVRRTVLSVGASTLSLSASVASLTTANNAIVRKVPRPSDVGNGWIESSHGQRLGTEVAGIQALAAGGSLRFRPVGGTSEAEYVLLSLFSELLDDNGYADTVADRGSVIDALTATETLASATIKVAHGSDGITLDIPIGLVSLAPDGNRWKFRIIEGASDLAAPTVSIDSDNRRIEITANEAHTVDDVGTALWSAMYNDIYGTSRALASITSPATTATTAITLESAATITVSDTTSFASSGTLVIAGTLVTYTAKTPTTFTGCVGTPATTSGTIVAGGLAASYFTVDEGDSTDIPFSGGAYTYGTEWQALATAAEANLPASVSPVVQRPLPQQNGLRIQGQFTTTDRSDDGKLMFILTRKKSTGMASFFYGFGAAIRRSAASTTATTVNTAVDDETITVSDTTSFASSGTLVIAGTLVTYTDKTPTTFTGCVGTPMTSSGAIVAPTATTATTAKGATTITVSSTASFAASGILVIAATPVTYTGKTATTFTGCEGTPETTTTGAIVAVSKNTLFIVDGGELGASDNNHLVANDTPIAAGANYWFELLITPPSGSSNSSASSTTELRIWLDDDTTVRPAAPTLSYGSYIPTSARNNIDDDTHFGISVYDNEQYEWSFDSLRVDSVAPVYPHYLCRFDATDFSERFKVQVKGRAYGEDNDAMAYGMTVRLWNESRMAWGEPDMETIGGHTEGTTALIESATSHSVMAYNDSNNFIWVMVSGDHPWGLAAASVLEVDYAAIIDDGVEGVHVGGKADIYVRSEGGILPSTVDLDGVDQLEVLNDETGFTLPIASVDAIFLLDGAGRPTGGALQLGVDYTLAVVNPNLRYSAHEQIALTFSPDVQGSSVRVFYSTFQFMEDIQAFMESGDQRLATADVLARAFLPAYVTVTIEMSGYTITDEAMRRGLVAFVNDAKRSIEPSDLINEAYRLGATSVETDLTVTVEKHALDGSKTTTTLTSRMELAENERFYARAVNVIRI